MAKSVPTKKCKLCGHTKPLMMFGVKDGNKDGHRSECKTCTNDRHKQRRVMEQFNAEYGGLHRTTALEFMMQESAEFIASLP